MSCGRVSAVRFSSFQPEANPLRRRAVSRASALDAASYLRGFAGGGILRRLAAGQLFLHGIQRPALAAGTGCAVGGKVGAAGFRLRVLGLGIAGVQGLQLAVSGVQMALPHVLFPAVGSSTGQQGRAPVHKGFGLLFEQT